MDVTDLLAGDDALIFQGNLSPHLFRYGKNAGAGGIRVDVSDVEVAIWTDQAVRSREVISAPNPESMRSV